MNILIIIFIAAIVALIVTIIVFLVKILGYFKAEPNCSTGNNENFYTTYPKFEDVTKNKIQENDYMMYENPRDRALIYGTQHRSNPGYNSGPFYRKKENVW